MYIVHNGSCTYKGTRTRTCMYMQLLRDGGWCTCHWAMHVHVMHVHVHIYMRMRMRMRMRMHTL